MTQDRSIIASITAWLLCGLGAFVLTGWVLGNPTMVRIVPGSVAISINTALMFFVAGACLLLKEHGYHTGRAFRAGAWFIVVLSSVILFEHIFHVDLPIDLASVHAALGDGHAKPGRTAPNACAGFLLAGVALLISTRHRLGGAWSHAGIVLAALTFGIGLAAFVGYLVRLDAMYQIAAYNRMATFTALGMLTLGLGLWTVPAQAQSAFPHSAGDDAARVTKLAAGLLMVFALATGLMSFAVLRDSFEKAAADAHLNTAKSSASSISSLLDQVTLLSGSVSRRAALRMPLERLAADPGDRAARNALISAAQAFEETGFSGVRISGADGQVLLSSGTLSGSDKPMQVDFGDLDNASSLGWKGGFILRNSHRVLRQGRAIATIRTEQRLASLNAFIDEARQASESTDILMCWRSGEQVRCFPSQTFPQGASFPMFAADGSAAFPITHALLGRAGSASVKDPRGIQVLAGYAPIPRHQLALLVRTNARELYMPLRDKLDVLLSSMLLFVILGVLLLRRWLQPLVAHIVEERQRMKAILDNSSDAFIAIGPDGAITDWNKQAEKTLGWEAKDAVGRDLAELIIPERQRAAHNHGFKKFLHSGTGPVVNSRLEVTALHASAKEIPVELSVTAMLMGQQYGASAFLRDLSERKAAEARAAEHASALEQAREALTQSQKLEAVGKLTGGVAHDFNNVLQVIKGSLELLREEHKDSYHVIRRVETAAGAVERGAKLAAQLLAFARKQPLQPKATNLGRVVRSMEEMLQRALGDAVEIELAVGGGLWHTLVDPHQLEQVILNLAINARDAMDGAGKLTIEVGNATLDEQYARLAGDVAAGQFAMLAVSDTGCGMAPDTIERAFEPFFSTKPEGQGTGLGLSMTYGFVKQSGGHIKIYSEVGEGTTIRIYLPRSFEAERLETRAVPDTVRGGKETILVVEDDRSVQSTVVDLLTGLGYQVLTADHAAAALEIIEAGAKIDLLFTDVVMPGELRSPELARRALHILPKLQVLFTSGYTQNAIVHGGRLDPGVHLLSKPYGRDQLGHKVRSLLDAAGAATAADPGTDAAGSAEEDGLLVAFVEDNDDFRMLGEELISMIGHRVESFASAEAALARIGQLTFDVLLTDIGLPGMSGTDLAQAVNASHPAIRIILASGYGEPPGNRQAYPYKVLTKPFTIEQLQETLQA